MTLAQKCETVTITINCNGEAQKFSGVAGGSVVNPNGDVQVPQVGGKAIVADVPGPLNQLVVGPGLQDLFCLRFHSSNRVKYLSDCSE